MASPLNSSTQTGRSPWKLSAYLPFTDWLLHYRRRDFPGDLLAGAIVATMLVPQAMAYAQLAGLPAQVGLYASILPLGLYGLLGTSRALAVGPVAIVSLLVASGIGPLAAPGSSEYLALALILALLAGLIQLGMGLVRLGFLVNFLSHSVISGFTSAAALIIGVSQLRHLLGVQVASADSFVGQLIVLGQALGSTNLLTLGIGTVSLGLLLFFKRGLSPRLQRWGLSPDTSQLLSKGGPLVVVVISTLLVWSLGLDTQAGVRTVGAVPSGLPPLTTPALNLAQWQALLPAALTISFVGFMESIAVAKSLASKRRQRIDPNQELIGLGMANLGAAFTGGYPVTGGFSRSVVNFAAGANTGLASIITAALVLAVVLFFTPLFFYLPQAALASIILVAVTGLIDTDTPRRIWRYSRADGFSLFATFGAVLAAGVEAGLFLGIGVSLILYLWRTSRPHIAIVGRLGDSEHFRNVLRHPVTTAPGLLMVRVDESLYFANTRYLEEYLNGIVADHPDVNNLVLVCSGINFIDANALETLEHLQETLAAAGVELYLSEVKGPVFDQLQRVGWIDKLGKDHLFLSSHAAMAALSKAG